MYREATAERVSERNDPYTIIETCGDLSSSKLPLGVAYPELVIADLTASPEWGLSSFEGMFKVLFSLFPECRDIQFLLVVYLLPTAVLDFLSSFKTFNRLEPIITFKPYIGFYEPEKQVDPSNNPVKSQGFIKVVVFVSAEGKDFPECPIEKKINLHSKKPLHEIEYFLRKPGGDTKAHERMWICEKAPCWRMVDNDDLKKRGRVHPYCKRVDDIEDIIYNWSIHISTIIDIFSGGVVLRAGLLASRQVVCFARSSQEALFLESFVKRLKELCVTTKAWCISYRTSKINEENGVRDGGSQELSHTSSLSRDKNGVRDGGSQELSRTSSLSRDESGAPEGGSQELNSTCDAEGGSQELSCNSFPPRVKGMKEMDTGEKNVALETDDVPRMVESEGMKEMDTGEKNVALETDDVPRMLESEKLNEMEKGENNITLKPEDIPQTVDSEVGMECDTEDNKDDMVTQPQEAPVVRFS
ncbi:hypothetical protein R1sor_000654 [Riccia sorocarpa]|uniref:Uncharacterized protein n=1 Tax=Riccia sorocarpa TaxID=122646 RepID=A0ABD3GW39_9MARC